MKLRHWKEIVASVHSDFMARLPDAELSNFSSCHPYKVGGRPYRKITVLESDAPWGEGVLWIIIGKKYETYEYIVTLFGGDPSQYLCLRPLGHSS